MTLSLSLFEFECSRVETDYSSLPLFEFVGLGKDWSKLPLRDYQTSMVQRVLHLYRQGKKRILAQLPTGGGKSLIISAIVADALQNNERIMLVAHKTELINQLADHANRWLKADYAIISDKSRYKRDYTKQIQISSPQALLYVDFEDLGDFGLIVVDECHHSHARSYARIFEYYQNARFLGTTATPARLDGRGLRKLYDNVDGFEELVTGITTQQLIERGYLSQFRLFGNPLLDTSQTKIKTTGGDFNKKELAEFALQADISGDLIENYQKFADGKRCIVYPASVELSKEYCQKFNDEGIPSGHIDAKTPHKERQLILDKFRDGEILVLCQHSIVIEGVDIPAIEAVLFARPTQSLIIWFQAIGRALRPCEGKDYAVIIDLTDNFKRLPLPTAKITWSLDAKPCIDEEFAHHCIKCNHLFQPTKYDYERLWGYCPNCGEKYDLAPPQEMSETQEKPPLIYDPDVELEEINIFNLVNEYELFNNDYQPPTSPQKLETIDFLTKARELKERQESFGYKRIWVYYTLKELVLDNNLPFPTQTEMRKLAEMLGYKSGWGFYKYKDLVTELAESQELNCLAS